ncbi:hypothetical protein PC129_g23631 [Phytophthora cactorum]|uniref:Uncharacterized protein n=1 Tax=Phytophthora cactorum TaxID=29920 RepID=A0A8T1JE57_9STRA|nr:hypothetical protein Pcac1_g20312 [Phytophthora cactorum]KAG2789443.1 hypothetical protein PC111_g24126 [Phytophthora cactorum]KAG2873127.1 hypothetical protein PC114_g26012 [Phytophthora cactorum]KAG2875950.1 hypothetical protein PC115_g23763 [Phytophthora cactorum]KAG2880448.1 hypothetical protein PC117_g26557 [Phytophthora cactorum]
MATKVELNKNEHPVNWQGQCWTYYKRMMEFSFADKEVLEYAKGAVTLASGASDVDKKISALSRGSSCDTSCEVLRVVSRGRRGSKLGGERQDDLKGRLGQ